MTRWQELMRMPARSLSLTGSIVFGSGTTHTLSGDEVVRLTVSEGADNALMPGAVLSAGCVLELKNDEGQWLPGGACLGSRDLIGATLAPELVARDGNTTYSAPLGIFQIERADVLEQAAVLRVRASDSVLFELAGDFSDGLTYPATLSQIWTHAVQQTRYTWSGTVPNGSAVVDERPDWKRITLRRALSLIAAAAGCFVRVTRDGTLELKRVWTSAAPAAEIGTDEYLKLERSGRAFGPLDCMKLTPVGRDSSGNPAAEVTCYADSNRTELFALTMAENPLYALGAAHLSALAQETLSQLAGMCGAEMEFVWRGDPTLRIGDTVEITDRNDDAYFGILSRQTMTFDGGFSAACTCAIPETNGTGVMRAFTPEGGLNAAALTGVVDGGLISARSITAEKIAAGAVTAEKIAAGAVEADAIDAVAAKIQTLTAADISTDRLAAALAAFQVIVCGNASFSEAAVRHLVAQAMQITDAGVAGKMYIENLAVKYAQIVSAMIGDLCIRASNGNYYRIDVTGSGTVTGTQVSLSAAEIEAGVTQSGRTILETDITAANLNTANLSATYALVNRIDAARIDVDSLFAREAFVGKLSTSLIADGKSISMLAGEIEDTSARTDNLDRAFLRVLNLDADGLHVGDTTSGSEVLIDSRSVSIVLNGLRFSKFGANYVQFGNYQLRRSADGGLVFKLMEA